MMKAIDSKKSQPGNSATFVGIVSLKVTPKSKVVVRDL